MNRYRPIMRHGIAVLVVSSILGGCTTPGGEQLVQSADTASDATVVSGSDRKEEPVVLVQEPIKDSYDVAVEVATDPLSSNRLILVSRYGHDDVVEFLLNSRVDVNARDDAGYTALIAAAEGGHLNTVNMLLEAKADVSASKPNGETALMTAAVNGYTEIIRALLDAGAAVDAKNAIGETALFNAVKYGHYDATRLLISYGAKINLHNTDKVSAIHSGFTPLMYAAGQGVVGNSVNDWDEIVELLLDKGASPNARTERGDTALSLAKRRYDPRIIALLESAGARQERLYTSLSENAALVKASRLGDVAKVRELIKAGVKVNARQANGVSALLAASFENELEVAKVLIDAGADVNDVPLGLRKWAITASSVSIFDQELIKSASRGDTALLVSVRRNYPEMAELLLSSGADPSLSNHQGDVPIFVAASQGGEKVLELILSRGVDPNVLETEKLTVSMTNTLEVMGRNTPLITAAQNGHLKAARVLIEAGADLDHQGFLNKTPLLWASERGYVDVVGLLLDNGANPNINDVEGMTPLMVAARSGSSPIVSMLLRHDADPNMLGVPDVPGSTGKAFGNAGVTALIYAARAGHNEIVKQLIDAGSNVNAMSRSGETAMRGALSNGYQDIVQFLKVSGAQDF